MKYYTTIITSLILSVVLLINTTAHAAVSVTPSWSTSVTTSIRAYLSNQYTVDYELEGNPQQPYPFGSTNIYVYTADFDILCSTNTGDAYINGMSSCLFSLGITTPTGYNLRSINWYLDENNIPGVYTNTNTRNTVAQNNLRITSYFNNFWSSENITLNVGTVHLTIEFTSSATPSNVPDPQSIITLSPTASISTNNLSANPDPDTMGFVAEIIAALNNAYIGQNTTEINDHVYSILSMLTSMAQTDSESYEDILDALASNNEWNAILSSWLNSISTDTLSISQDTSEMLGFLSNYLPKLRTIDNNILNIYNKFAEFFTYYKQQIEKGNTAASSAVQDVQSVESKADIINDIYKPPVDGYLDEVNLRITPEVSGGMQTFLAFINRPYFVLILTMVFSLAFVSYLLYGKGV